MWLKLLALALPLAAQPATFSRFECRHEAEMALCKIELQGKVNEGERLYLSRVHDRDTLSFRGREIGSTGTFFGRPFHVGFFPRFYSLDSLKGEDSPTLILVARGGLVHTAGIPRSAIVSVVDASYPLWKILGPTFFQLLSFGLLLQLTAYLIAWQRLRNTDGWLYPKDELRWFLGSLSAYLALRHEVSELAVPFLWAPLAHIFAQRLALSVALWSLAILLLNGRFSDRSCIERGRPHSSSKYLARLAHAAFLLSLGLLACFPHMSERSATSLLALPLLPLVAAFGRSLQEMEWQRILKRSSLSPLLFQFSLLALPPAVLAAQAAAVWLGNGDQRALEAAGWAAFLCSGLRMRSFVRGREKSRQLATDCRSLLMQHSHGSGRLQALCDFVGEEWGAARITVISVEEETGLVLASAGPDAIPSVQRAHPQRLGPFLRRVCKQNQMLYAPVAEELGKDLQNQGLKHSSLAIPLVQEHKIRAVFCMMADEGERIPPNDANQLEILIETLSLELLSAVAQNVAETKSQQLMNIARMADALAVEHLDHWGHFHQASETETRVVLGGDCVPAGPFLDQLKRSPVFGKLWSAYRTEMRALWTALATSFEFIPKDNRDDFWVISPRQFRNPLLQELGPERVSVLLANALERHGRALSMKECYSPFGYCGVRLVSSTVRLRRSVWHGSAVEIDSDDFTFLLELRNRALPGTVLFHGNAPGLITGETAFTCRVRPWEEIENRQIFSILFATADKKEMKRMENQALDQVRGLARKAA